MTIVRALACLLLPGCITAPTVWATISGEGSLTAEPQHLECTDSCGIILDGPTVLTAVPAPGWTFSGWQGLPGCSGTEPCTPMLDRDASVEVAFAPIPKPIYTLTVSLLGGQGVVRSTPMGILCTSPQLGETNSCGGVYEHGTQLTLIAEPYPGPGTAYRFVRWSGSELCGTSPTCALTFDRDLQLTAELAVQP